MVFERKACEYCEYQLLQLEDGRSRRRVPGGVFSPIFRSTGVFGELGGEEPGTVGAVEAALAADGRAVTLLELAVVTSWFAPWVCLNCCSFSLLTTGFGSTGLSLDLVSSLK